MDSYPSWTSIVTVLAVIALALWMMREHKRVVIEREILAEIAIAAAAAVPVAHAPRTVTSVPATITPAFTSHLKLVPALEPEPELYDWAKSGL